MYLHSVPVEVDSWYRTDSASGSSTPVSVFAPDGVTTVANAFGLSGSTVRNRTVDGRAVFQSATAVLYLKRLTYQGALSGDTPITSTGRDLTPTPEATPGGDAAALLAALAPTVPVAPVASAATSGTLTSGAEHTLTPATVAAWTLPTGVAAAARPVTVKNNGTATVTVARGGSDTINGGTAATSIAPGEWARYTSNGAGAWTQSGTAGQTGTYAQLKLLSSLAKPYTICHNGTNNVIPPHTFAGYEYAMSLGLPILDIDVQLLAAGQLANMHNSTVDADTTGTGNVNTFTSFDFKKLTTDASSWLAPGYADTNPTLVSDILGRYGTRAIYVIEAKDGQTSTVQKIVDLLTALGLKSQAIVQSTVLASLAPAVAAGITANVITDGPNAAAMAAAGVSMVTMSYSAGTTAISNAVAAGLSVWVYQIQRRYDHAVVAALGVAGIVSDDPQYSSSTTAFMTRDTFARQTWAPGQLIDVNGRGSLVGSGKLQFAVGQNASTLLGFLCPVANAAGSYQIDWTWTYDAIGGSASGYPFLHIGAPDDRVYPNGISGAGYADGWRFQLQQNGTLAVYKTDRAGNTATNPVANVGATAPTDGASVVMRANVTPTQVILTIPAQSKTVTVTDSSFRGGYIHCGQAGLAAGMQTSLSGLTIT